jgi:hypothetical protein
MSATPVSLGVPIGIARKPVLHASRQIWLGSLNQRVNVIWHPAKGENNPATALYLILQSLREALVVAGIVEQPASAIPARDDMSIGTCELDTFGDVASGGTGRNLETERSPHPITPKTEHNA